MKEKIEALRAQLQQQLQSVGSLLSVEELRVAYLGKKGRITDLLKSLRELSSEEKRAVGQEINLLKAEAAEAIAAKQKELAEREALEKLRNTPRYDVTVPFGETLGSRIRSPSSSVKWRKFSRVWALRLRTIPKL